MEDLAIESYLMPSIHSILATIGLFVLLWSLKYIYKKLIVKIVDWKGTKIQSIKFRAFELLTADRIISSLLFFFKYLRIIIVLTLLYFYIPLVFSFFPWTSDLTPKIYNYVLDPIKRIFQVTFNFIPNVFFIVITIIITNYILRFIKFLFSGVENGSFQIEGFYKDWATPTYKLIRILILSFTLIIIFPYFPGSGSPAFQGISVFLGILLSLGSSSAIANMVSGVLLIYMRPFKVGDRVKIANTVGDVIEKKLLVIRVRTIKNVDITIPSSMILASHIVNYSSSAQSHGLIINTVVTIGYETPWRRVNELLIKAALKTKDVSAEPAPFIFQIKLNDFHASYELNCYTKQPNLIDEINSELNQNIQDLFREAEVLLISPNYYSLIQKNNDFIHQPNQGSELK
ncbi:mechanosensitive ion channel family protein [Fluviispira multicolorata]|uniref:Mechanosensitive ion channel n=1 Tax=Fluviispira multicolorata TaxID=2654512 RepID=A0A833JDL4_9BACT|nr:mechanosensitive ion channel domain-containing protein [Fluviispira multicolorata]KAB8030975.1 mechanosensitive ion channel [Fluviispira multicolorata]